MEIKNIGDFMNVAESLEYRYANTYANAKTNPHEYCYATDPDTIEKVRALNKYIQEHGEKEMFYKTEFDVLFAGEYKYWSMDYWANTSILNRNWDRKNEDGTINKSKTEAMKDNGNNK